MNTEMLGSEKDIPAMTEEEQIEVRKYIALHHASDIKNLYMDDGEIQCSNCEYHRPIDFKRETITAILDELQIASFKKFINSIKEKDINSYPSVQDAENYLKLLEIGVDEAKEGSKDFTPELKYFSPELKEAKKEIEEKNKGREKIKASSKYYSPNIKEPNNGYSY